MIINTNTKTEISISSYGVKASCELSCDASIDEVMTAFKGMLVSITYPPSLFDDWVLTQAEILNESINDSTDYTRNNESI